MPETLSNGLRHSKEKFFYWYSYGDMMANDWNES